MAKSTSIRLPVDPTSNTKLMRRAIIWTAALVCLILIPVVILGYFKYRDVLMTEARLMVARDLTRYTAVFNQGIDRRTAALSGLGSFVQTRLDQMEQAEFVIYAAGVSAPLQGVRNQAVAPAGIVKFVFPYAGNEAAIGHDLMHLDNADKRADVEKAIATGEIISTGPYPLLQGGEGLVFRKAIFDDNQLWGLVSIVLDLDTLFELSGLNADTGDLQIAVRSGERLLTGKPDIFAAEPITAMLNVADKQFEIAAVPTGGWNQTIRDRLNIYLGFAALVSIVFAWIILALAKRSGRQSQVIQTSQIDLKLANDQLAIELAEKAHALTLLEQSQSNLLSLNEELELRVDERTKQLKSAYREMESFTYSVSHDLKAPLRGIDGYSRLLQEEASGHLNADELHFLGMIRQSAGRMNQLIDDLLTYSRLERKPQQFEPVDLHDLIEGIATELKKEFVDQGGRVEIHVPSTLIKTNVDGVSMALKNLIENAIKYSRDVERPMVEIDLTEDSEKVMIQVKDNGIGFDMKYHDKIFQIFERLHTLSDYPGTGIGLALVRRVAERIGGRTWAVSEPGSGSIFYFEIPKSKEN